MGLRAGLKTDGETFRWLRLVIEMLFIKKSLVNPAKAIKVILFSLSFRENERENKES